MYPLALLQHSSVGRPLQSIAAIAILLAAGCTPPSPAPVPQSPPTASIPEPTVPTAPAEPEVEPEVAPEEIAAAAQKRLQGLEARGRGDRTGAIAAFEAAVNLDPTNLNGLVLLGWTLHLDGRGDRAIAVLKEALTLDADHIPALNALGIAYLVTGNLDAAVAAHTRAADLDSQNEIAFYNLSLAYERLQQFDRAIAMATRATELEPGNPHPWVALALAHWSAGDIPQAQQQYRQAIALDGRYRTPAYLNHLAEAGFAPDQIDRTRSLLATLP